jgi:hypothetical protein
MSMTSQDALAGFHRLQTKFKESRYRGADLNPIWADLLQYRVEAFEKAIGVMLMHSQFLPAPWYVLDQTRQWESKIGQGDLAAAESGALSSASVAKESLRLSRGYLEGTLPLREYVAGLYLLSKRTGCVEYAEEAMRKEKTLMNQGGCNENSDRFQGN